jgi:hypothetical protein
MATRAECDEFYRWAGFTQGFDPNVNGDKVLQRAACLPEAQACHLRRAVAVAAMPDPEEYFDVSEYATSPQAVEAMAGDPARAGTLVLALMPSWSDTTAARQQRPYALRVLRPYGHCHQKMSKSVERYAAVPLRFVACDGALRRCLYDSVGNLPPERTRLLLRRGEGWLLYPRSLHEVFMDVGDGHYHASSCNTTLFQNWLPWVLNLCFAWGKEVSK